jgi:hypothetical protein
MNMIKRIGNKRLRIKSTINIFSFLLLLAYISISSKALFAQDIYRISHNDSLALENVIVEKYYIADSNDYADTTGGLLPKGSITYRIYIDMKPDYSLQLVYGDKKHELFISTSTLFFNNTECMAQTGFNIDAKKINNNTIALDSWITLGAASRLHTGILKAEDTDGSSYLKRPAFINADGLTKGNLPTFKVFNLDLNFFNNDSTATRFFTNNGGWGALGGVKGPNSENKVLIAQLTTNGKLSFEMNIQIGTPTRGVVKFVAKNPEGSEIQFKGLGYK